MAWAVSPLKIHEATVCTLHAIPKEAYKILLSHLTNCFHFYLELAFSLPSIVHEVLHCYWSAIRQKAMVNKAIATLAHIKELVATSKSQRVYQWPQPRCEASRTVAEGEAEAELRERATAAWLGAMKHEL